MSMSILQRMGGLIRDSPASRPIQGPNALSQLHNARTRTCSKLTGYEDEL